MPKRKDVNSDADDDSLFEDADETPSRKFSGTDDEPVDDETGETLFDDLTPRLRNIEIGDELDDEDEEEELEASASDEEQEEEEQPRGKGKWSKRLDRAQRLLDEQREDNQELRERLEKLEQATASRASDETFEKEKADADKKIAGIRARLVEAKENGDTAAETALTEELTDAKIDIRAKQIAHEQAKSVTPPPKKDGIVTRKVNQWVRKHTRYNTDKVFASFAKAIDKELAGEGLDPETDEYYEELDKRIAVRYPEEYKNKGAAPPRRKHPSANFQQNGGRRPAPKSNFAVKGGKVQLTPRQIANMRNFGLDPTDPAERKNYVINNR